MINFLKNIKEIQMSESTKCMLGLIGLLLMVIIGTSIITNIDEKEIAKFNYQEQIYNTK